MCRIDRHAIISNQLKERPNRGVNYNYTQTQQAHIARAATLPRLPKPCRLFSACVPARLFGALQSAGSSAVTATVPETL